VLFLDLHGTAVPALGFGTYRLTGDACREAVLDALALGYRHLDTAAIYGNEAEVGDAMRRSDVSREEVFLTTKVWFDDLAAPDVQRSAEASLRRLGTDYVDLLLVHWPSRTVPLEETLGAFERLRAAGKTRAIGVSNFPPGLFAQALEIAPVACNQVEYHLFLDQTRIHGLCQKHGAMLTAYRPLAGGTVGDDPTVRAVAEAHGVTPAQVALRWLLQQDRVATIPKAASPAHRRANLAVLDFTLSGADMARLTPLTKANRRFVNPSDTAPDWEA
jgi:2,5-diketo-D-gluconate reductase B